MTKTYSDVYRRPDGRVSAGPVAYSTARAAMLGPVDNQYVGHRLGLLTRVAMGPQLYEGEPFEATMENYTMWEKQQRRAA